MYCHVRICVMCWQVEVWRCNAGMAFGRFAFYFSVHLDYF